VGLPYHPMVGGMIGRVLGKGDVVEECRGRQCLVVECGARARR
jgi:hypothetical protein